MSWIIQTLLRNSLEIRSKQDIESDEFNDLMIVESKIKSLCEDGIISDEEMELIRYIEDGKPLVGSKEVLGKNRIAIAKDIESLCNKIAFYLGGYFTDDGYIDYMQTKYELTEQQVGELVDYMRGKYKNKLIRKRRKTNE